MATMGGGAYLADPSTGECTGIDNLAGCRYQLVPGALRRLRKLAIREGIL